MNIKMQSKIVNVQRGPEHTVITLDFVGRVQDTKLVAAKDATMQATLQLKTAMAGDLRLGSLFTLTITDENVVERID
jgi:hypothetical protein